MEPYRIAKNKTAGGTASHSSYYFGRNGEQKSVEQECGFPSFCDLNSTNWGIPVILISQGRSGSQSLWTTLEGLFRTDNNTANKLMGVNEDVGMDKRQIQNFMQRNQKESKCWLVRLFCRYQQANFMAGRRPAMYGTKWKPYMPGFNMTAARDALTWVAATAANSNKIKVIVNQRNPLHVLLSKVKHQNNRLPAHCKRNNTSCFQRHQEAVSRTVLNVTTLLRDLQDIIDTNEQAIQILKELQVPYVKVSYEKLFVYDDEVKDGRGGGGSESAQEWQRAANFVGLRKKGTKSIITRQDIERVTVLAATTSRRSSSSDPHESGVAVPANYGEVAQLLRGTKYEVYLKD